MTPNRSLFRVAALTGVAAFLFSFAHVSPAAAQTPTRFAKTCLAHMEEGLWLATCNVTVPAGRRFVIESASVGGDHPSSQHIRVSILTKVGNVFVEHNVPAGFQVLRPWTWWSGALAGTIFAEPGLIQLKVHRGDETVSSFWFRMTVSGYLEDIATGLLY